MTSHTGKRTRRASIPTGAVTKIEPVTTVTPSFAINSDIATSVDHRDGYRSPEDESEHSPVAPRLAQSNTEIRYGERHEIGRGGMGLVYQVLDKDLNRNVAMKVLSCGKFDQDSAFRFVAEAQISGQLEHPALLPIHDIGVDDDGKSFFTMRYVPEHETLEDIIELLKAGNKEAHELYTIKRRVQIIQRVCDALTYAHERGVVHRDIKPSNILVGATGEVYLADWGVAFLVGQDTQTAINTNLERGPDDEGKIIGTPLYMSPEQLLANCEITSKSDVYSLCAVAYELLSLTHYLGPKPPLAALAIYEAIKDCPRIDAELYIHPVGGRVPRQLSRILRYGLQHDRDAAIASAQELEEALQRWVEGNAPIVCPGTFLQHWLGRFSRAIDRRPVLLPILVIGLLALVAASIATSAVVLVNALT